MRRNSTRWDPDCNEQLDQLIHDALSRAPQYSVPTEEQKKTSWLEVKQKLDMEKRRNRIRTKMQWFSVVAASITLGALLFSPPLMTQAVSPFYQQIKQMGTGLIQVVFGKDTYVDTTHAKTAPPPDVDREDQSNAFIKVGEVEKLEPQLVTLEEAKRSLSFTLPNLPSLPSRFQLENISLFQTERDKPAGWIEFRYKATDAKQFCISMRRMEGNRSINSTSTVDTREIKLDNGSKAFFSGGELPQIKFMEDNIYIHMYGALTEEELLKAANQIGK